AWTGSSRRTPSTRPPVSAPPAALTNGNGAAPLELGKEIGPRDSDAIVEPADPEDSAGRA
ncbi:hypothetical protein, partial [Streptomyces boncukensis]